MCVVYMIVSRPILSAPNVPRLGIGGRRGKEGKKIATDDQGWRAYLCEKPGTRNFYFSPPAPSITRENFSSLKSDLSK